MRVRKQSPSQQGVGGLAHKPDLELERIHISARYTLFVFGIHTGYTLYNPGIHM